MAASQSILEIIIQAVDQSAAGLENAQNNLKDMSQAAVTAGTQLAIAGAAITAAYVGIVDSAANVQESQDNLKQAVTDAMAGASTSSNSYATQVKFLQDKIDSYKASIASATATLDTHTGSTEKVAAAHEAAAAKIATDQVNMAKYQAQLDILQNSQQLEGDSLDDITGKLDTQATANVSLGFSIADSTRSLSQAFTATKSVSEAMQVNQAAMDLARAKNIDLATATNQVILAMNGQGRALATYGIQIKDGLSGMEALQAVQGAVNGQSQAYAETLTGQLSIAMASFNKLLSDMGSTQLPLLTKLLEVFVKIIDAVDSWITAHPKLTEALLVFVGVLGVMLTILGTVLVVVGTVGLALTAGLSAAFVGIAAAVAVAIAALVAIGVAVVENWDYIRDNFVATWQTLESFFSTGWNWVKSLFSSSLGEIGNIWNTAWQGMSDFLGTIWNVIKTTIKDGINYEIWGINAFINALDAIHISLPSISIPGTKIATPALNLGFNIPDIPMLAAGGIVTGPTLALIGEGGPEAVVPLSSMGAGGPGGQQIVININGGIFPADSSAIRQIGDLLAKQINMSLRTRNYAS
jgi:phage-related minor tail protein